MGNDPKWLVDDIATNERMRALKAETTPGRWEAPKWAGADESDREDPYVGTIDVHADEIDEDGEGVDPIQIFDAGSGLDDGEASNGDVPWVAAAHEDDAEARYDRLLAAYRDVVSKIGGRENR